MEVSNRRHLQLARRGLASALIAALIAAPAYAAPTLPSDFASRVAAQQEHLSALRSELDELDRQLGLASEAYNEAAEQLRATSAELEATERDLANAETALTEQRQLLAGRAQEIYRAGDVTVLDIVLGAKSLSDLVARLRFLGAIGASDAELVATLKEQRDSLARLKQRYAEARERAAELEFTLAVRRIEIEHTIEERQQMLAAAEAELVALLEEEAARRRLEEADLLRAILSGADGTGITVEAGSPVETALAYHGIPYVWGGESPADGFDCSGLVKYVFAQHGVDLPHYSRAQFALGSKVTPAELESGDVVFFGNPVYHVGIYVGGGYFIHAPRTGDFVKLSPLAERTDYAGARRYAWRPRMGPTAGHRPRDDTVTRP